jgi:hypothetical protein
MLDTEVHQEDLKRLKNWQKNTFTGFRVNYQVILFFF